MTTLTQAITSPAVLIVAAAIATAGPVGLVVAVRDRRRRSRLSRRRAQTVAGRR